MYKKKKKAIVLFLQEWELAYGKPRSLVYEMGRDIAEPAGKLRLNKSIPAMLSTTPL
jgi:hypothetical protein